MSALIPETTMQRLIKTPDGDFAAWFSQSGLCRLDFPSVVRSESDGPAFASGTSPEFEAWLQLTRTALFDALSGRNPRQLPPLDLSAGTEFQRRVWLALLEIPAGQTRSYQEIADDLHSPGAARAVGGGCGANPIPILVPCHRVVAADRRLGGFSGGLEWKIRLLKREGTWPLRRLKTEPELALA